MVLPNLTQAPSADGDLRTVSFGECATLIRENVSVPEAEDVPYVGLEHIGQGTLSLLAHGQASSVTSTKARFRQGDILFGKLRPYFRKVVKAPFDGICSTDIWVVRAKEGVDLGFLYYCMASWPFVDFATAGSQGTRMPRAKWEHVSRYDIFLPPLQEQRAIAHILGTLDDKIELNRCMNGTLEEMARALFKSWFVDFDPVRAKMEGRWRRGESLPGMPAELYDLFPDGMVDSELGEIPEGWEVSEIGREVEVVGGSTPSTKVSAFWDNGEIHWATPKDLSGLQTLVLLGTKRKISSAGLGKISSGLLPSGTVLMSSRAPVGYLAIAQVPLAVNQGFIAMKCCKRISRGYVLFWCDINMDIIKANASGTTFAEISKRNFRPLKIIVPETGPLSLFDGIFDQIFEKITVNDLESRTLAALRDSLLPKLMSGEVRVEDVAGL